MGWLWLVGSLKLQVSFAKEPYKRDDILQRGPIILRSLLTVATPYHTCLASDIYDTTCIHLKDIPHLYIYTSQGHTTSVHLYISRTERDKCITRHVYISKRERETCTRV